MASTYSDRLRFENIGTGEQDGVWGDSVDNNICVLIEESIAGVAAVSMTDANYTLTTSNGSTDEARQAVLEITSSVSLTATRNVIVPTKEKIYLVYNNTTGSQSLVFKTSGGTGITVASGKKALIYCDGTNVVDAISALPSGTTIGGATVVVGGANTSITSVFLSNTGLKIYDTNASHGLTIAPGSNITADRTLTITTGDANRTLDISVADVTVTAAGAALLDDANAAAQRATLGLVIGTDVQAYDADLTTLGAGGAGARSFLGLSDVVTLSVATASQIRANTADKVIDTDGGWSSVESVTLTDAATISVDMSTFINATVTLGGNRTLGQPNLTKVGQSGWIRIIQDGTGSRTLAYHSDWKFAGGVDPTLSTAAGAVDVLFYVVLASNFVYANLVKALA